MWVDWKQLTFCSHLSSKWTGTRLDCFGMSGCDLYLEKRARETDGEIKRQEEAWSFLHYLAAWDFGGLECVRDLTGPGDALIAACMLEGFCWRRRKKEAALLFHWLLVVTRLWHHGAFTGQRDDSDGDYIYQPVSSGVNCASMWAEPRVSGVSPFPVPTGTVDIKHNINKRNTGVVQHFWAPGDCWIERDVTSHQEVKVLRLRLVGVWALNIKFYLTDRRRFVRLHQTAGESLHPQPPLVIRGGGLWICKTFHVVPLNTRTFDTPEKPIGWATCICSRFCFIVYLGNGLGSQGGIPCVTQQHRVENRWLERYLNKAQLICRGCSRPPPQVTTRPLSLVVEEGGLMETTRPAGFSISTKVVVLLPVNSLLGWSHRPVCVFCCRLTNLCQHNRRRGQRRKTCMRPEAEGCATCEQKAREVRAKAGHDLRPLK